MPTPTNNKTEDKALVYNSPYPAEVTYTSDKNFLVRLKAMIDRELSKCDRRPSNDQFQAFMDFIGDNAENILFASRTATPAAPSRESEAVKALRDIANYFTTSEDSEDWWWCVNKLKRMARAGLDSTPSPSSDAAAALDWIKVEHSADLLDLQGINSFLVPVNHTNGNRWWDIVVGYIDNTGELCSQVNDEPSGWRYGDVMYYKTFDKLPDLPTI